MYANSNTMAMLIKLLATRIVAKSFLGLSNNLAIISMALEPFSSPSLIWLFVNENKATSAPEISAEHSSSTIRAIMLIAKDELVIKKKPKKHAGSGSKVYKLKCI